MNKISVIDLLNKIAKGEEVPKKIITLNSSFEYNEYDNDYYCGNTSLFTELVGATDLLEEVIIEEDEMKKYDVIDESGAGEICGYKNFKFDINLSLKEHKEEILDDVEKEYLRAVIKPFRNEIAYIIKDRDYYDERYSRDFIYIMYKTQASTNLPYFKKGTMYKGMESDKKYTLEELGLE